VTEHNLEFSEKNLKSVATDYFFTISDLQRANHVQLEEVDKLFDGMKKIDAIKPHITTRICNELISTYHRCRISVPIKDSRIAEIEKFMQENGIMMDEGTE